VQQRRVLVAMVYCYVPCLVKQSKGVALDNWRLSGNVVDPTSACTYAQKEDNKIALAEFYVDKAIVFTFLGEYEPALVAAKKSYEFVPYADYRRSFYEGLSALASARVSTGRSRRKLIVLAKKRLKNVQYWSSKGSSNFHNMVALLQAELAAIRGKGQLALSLFDKSVKAAKKERFIHTEGLAYERLASYHRFLGHEPSAIAYFERARDCYQEWGAYTVVRRIEQGLLTE
jgi:tetratricopeptide (TPR) repeat protein